MKRLVVAALAALFGCQEDQSDPANYLEEAKVANAAVSVTKVARHKLANQSWTADTTFADVTDLTFAMAANQKWKIRVVMFVDNITGGDCGSGIKYQINGPASPTNIQLADKGYNHTTNAHQHFSTMTALTTPRNTNLPSAAGTIELEGVYENGVNAGTFAVQAAQQASDADPAVVKRGSFIEAVLLP